eukprot:CAMPEP_0196703084 /NCGR_PEP_ID=MMETSP1090-20130531/55096_1 /TAXON_ID=37098 /ORGANISM="Isochrysis sp, Strain CCMP1244" /LENGTH=57 /DNA_ID=CAMNT_0042042927 /DNA_START=238 /DNA_END=407 /DNA_ORIENTATION=+
MFSSSLLVVPQEEVRHDVGAPYLQRQAARVAGRGAEPEQLHGARAHCRRKQMVRVRG